MFLILTYLNFSAAILEKGLLLTLPLEVMGVLKGNGVEDSPLDVTIYNSTF